MSESSQPLSGEIDRIEGNWVVVLMDGEEVSLPRTLFAGEPVEGGQISLTARLSDPDESIQSRIADLQKTLKSDDGEDFTF